MLNVFVCTMNANVLNTEKKFKRRRAFDMVTIYDVASKANVSAMTVSRVINNTGRISDRTRAKVKQVMDELGYVPNSMARSLVLQQTKLLSLLILDITNPFYTTLARGAEDAAMQAGYKLILSNSDEYFEKEKAYVDILLSMRVDGVLIAPVGNDSTENLTKFRQHGVPFVLLDREVPNIESDRVVGDSLEGAQRLVDYLIGIGHRRIALLNGSMNVSTARHRYMGYVESLKCNNLPFDENLVVELGYSHIASTDSMNIINTLVTLDNTPTTIFAANNSIALATVRALREAGIDVPNEMSVACFDEMETSTTLDPFLTFVAQPAYQFGYLGMQLLIDRIQQKTPQAWQTITLPSELMIRQSTVAQKGM